MKKETSFLALLVLLVIFLTSCASVSPEMSVTPQVSTTPKTSSPSGTSASPETSATPKINNSPKIVWHDDLIESVIREKIGKTEGDVFVDDVQYIEELDCRVFREENGYFVTFGLELQDLDLLKKLTRINYYNHDGSLYQYTIYERDSEGHILTDTIYCDSEFTLAEVHTEFDSAGNPVSGIRTRTLFHGDETIVEPPFYYSMKYTPTGKLLEKSYFEYIDDEVFYQIEDKYHYDAAGNLDNKESIYYQTEVEQRYYIRDNNGKCNSIKDRKSVV